MRIKDPVFIIGCPRSGTTLLFTILRASNELWKAHSESHFVWEKFLPDKRDPMFSVYLTAADYKSEDQAYLERKYFERSYKNNWAAELAKYAFYNKARNLINPIYSMWRAFLHTTRSMSDTEARILDKTPPNVFRVSYLAKAFPNAKFIYITRNGASNISSLIEGWKSTGRFNFKFRSFYPENERIDIKGYEGKVWKFINPPGWENYLDKSLEEVCAFQWLSAHEYAQKAFTELDSSRVMQVKYEDLVADPVALVPDICDFVNLEYDAAIRQNCEKLPVVSTATKPNPDKWLKNKELIMNVAATIDDMQTKLGYESLLSSEARV